MANVRSQPLALFTDLYELTMMQAYLAERMNGIATFSLFVRRLPPHRNFLIACGLEQVLAYLEDLHFSNDDIAYLASLNRFSTPFLESLRAFRFTGDVHAVPEGTPVFANEPLLEIVAPISEAQLVETCVMNQIQLQTLLASKAARVVAAARGRAVVDFGARRTHGVDAAVDGARAFYIAGARATSNVLAAQRYGIPVAGTMAHSYIQAHADEGEAFRAFAREFPGTTLLVDTYETLDGIRSVIDVIKRLPDPVHVAAVRLDSGDLVALTRESRGLLDAAGLHGVRIFVSSSLDEYRIDALLSAGAPIDGFGVGTAMSVSADAPSLDIVYKLAEYSGHGRTKLSHDKPILPGRKQLFRHDENGEAIEDVIAKADEHLDGRPLLTPVMRNGRRVAPSADALDNARERAARELARLPARVRSLEAADPPYSVRVSAALERHHAEVRAGVAAR
jgi:nicotinate phosphoribosyltransferase